MKQSTVAGVGIGVPLATIASWLFSLTGIAVPGPVEAAFGVVLTAVIVHFWPEPEEPSENETGVK